MAKQEALYRMDKTSFSVSTLTAPSDEKEYWLAKTATERLQALEFLRQIAYGYDPATTRLQRVLTVAELTRSWISAHRWLRQL